MRLLDKVKSWCGRRCPNQRANRRLTMDRRPLADFQLVALEDRRVFNASYQLAGGQLLLSNFSNGTTLTLDDNGSDRYEFKLSSGQWSGTQINGTLERQSNTTLWITKTAFNNLANGLRINGNSSLNINFNPGGGGPSSLDYSNMQGPFRIDTANVVSQAVPVLIDDFIVSADTVNLINSGNNFQTLSASADDLRIVDTDDLQLVGTNTVGLLSISAGGLISDNGSQLTVQSDAEFIAGLGIELVTNAAVDASESLQVTSHARFEVLGNAEVRLGATTNGGPSVGLVNFGSLEVFADSSTGDSIIYEDSSTVLDGVTHAHNLVLISAGNVTDANAELLIQNALYVEAVGDINLADGATLPGANSLAAFTGMFITAAGTSVRVGVQADGTDSTATVTLSELEIDAPLAEVRLSLDSSTSWIGQTDVAGLRQSVAGGIDATNSVLVISGDATFIATGNITIANDTDANGDGSTTDVLQVGGAAAFAAGSGNIQLGLDDGGNSFVSFGSLSLSGAVAEVYEDSAVDLDTSAVTSLVLHAIGDITQVGEVDVTGSMELVTSAGSAVQLAAATNTLGGLITIRTYSPGDQLSSLELTSDATSVTLNSLASTTGNMTLTASHSGLSLTGLTVGGSLFVSAKDDIADLANISVVGDARFVSSLGGITLGESGESLSLGTLRFTAATAVNITAAGSILLVGDSAADSLALTASGAITDDGTLSLDITDDATFTAGDDIVLAITDSGSSTGLSVGGRARFESNGSLVRIGVTAVGSPVDAVTSFGELSFAALAAASQVAIHVDGSTTLVGDNSASALSLSVAGDLGDFDAKLSVTGDASIQADGSILLMLDANNNGNSTTLDVLDIQGTVTLQASSTGQIRIGEELATVLLGNINVTAGTVNIREDADAVLQNVSATNLTLRAFGNISQTAAIVLPGNLSLSASSTHSIHFGMAANSVGGTLSTSSLDALPLSEVILHSAGLTTTLGALADVSGNLTITFTAADVDLPGVTVGGDLFVSSSGAISDSGTVSVASGQTTLVAGTTITLGESGEDPLFDAVTFQAGSDVNISSAQSLELVGANQGAQVSLSSEGNLTDADGASLTVSGDLLLSSQGNIVLADDPNEDGLETIAISGALQALAAPTGNVQIGFLTAGSPSGVSITAASLDFSGAAVKIRVDQGVDLAAASATTLELIIGGSVSQLGSLVVAGVATFTLADGSDLILNHSANNLQDDVFINTIVPGDTLRDVSLTSSSANVALVALPEITRDLTLNFSGANVTLGSYTVGRDLQVTAGGNIVDPGTLSVASGTARFVATGNITLGQASQNSTWDRLNFSAGGQVVLQSLTSVTLTGANAAASFSATIQGDLSDADGTQLTVTAGPTTIDCTGSIVLADFADGNTDDLLSLSGLATITSQSGAIRIGTTAAFVPTAANVTLSRLQLNGSAAFVAADSAVILSGSSLQDLTLWTAGNLTQDAAVTIGHALVVNASAGSDVLLSDVTNQLAGSLAIRGWNSTDLLSDVHVASQSTGVSLSELAELTGDLTLNFTNTDIVLGDVVVGGDLALIAGGQIQDSDNWQVASGKLLLTAGDAITLGDGVEQHTFQTITLNAPGTVWIRQAQNIVIDGTNSAGALLLDSSGSITDTDGTRITVVWGSAIFSAISGITLADDPNGDGVDQLIANANGFFYAGGNSAIRVGVTAGDLDSNATTQFGSLTITSPSPTVTVRLHEDNNLLLVGSSNVQQLNLSSDGAISGQDENIRISGNATFTAQSTISLANDTNANGDGLNRDLLDVTGRATFVSLSDALIQVGQDGGGVAITRFGEFSLTGGDVLLTVDGNTTGQAVDVSDLTLKVFGNLTQSTAWLTDVLNLQVATGGNVLLTQSSNDFQGAVTLGTVSGAGNLLNVTLVDQNQLLLTGLPTVNGDLTVQTGAALELPAIVVGGSLFLTANGNITQSAAWQVSGTTQVQFTNTQGAVTPNFDLVLLSGNLLAGGVNVSGVANSLRDLSLRNISSTPQAPIVTGAVRNFSLFHDQGSATLAALNVTGDLWVRARGGIFQSAASIVQGQTHLESTLNGSDIVWDAAGNQLTGGLTVDLTGVVNGRLGNVSLTNSISGGQLQSSLLTFGNVVLNYANASLQLMGVVSGGDLQVLVGGGFSSTGALVISGDVIINTLGSGVLLDLGQTGNEIAGTIEVQTQATAVVDVNLRNEHASAQTPSLPSTLRDLTIEYTLAPVVLPQINVTGDLVVVSHGNIGQQGPVQVTGVTDLLVTQHLATINLGTAGNRFDGPLNIGTSVGVQLANLTLLSDSPSATLTGAVNVVGNLSLQFANADVTLLGGSVGGNLSLVAGGNITQSAALQVTGTTTLSVNALGSDIILNDTGNVFQGALSVTSSPGIIRDLWLANASGTAALPLLPGQLRNLTLGFANAAIALPQIDVTGNLSVTAGGDVSQFGPLTVQGTTTVGVTVNHAHVVLNHASNLLVGQLGLVLPVGGRLGSLFLTNTANSIVLTGVAEIVGDVGFQFANAAVGLDSYVIGGNFSLIAGGHITQAGPLEVTGTTHVTVLQPNTDVLLNDSGNLLAGTIQVLAANAGTLRNVELFSGSANAQLGPLAAVSNDLTLMLPSTISISLSGLSVGGDLHIRSGGSITQSAAWQIVGSTTLETLGAGSDLLLGQLSNNLQGVVNAQGIGGGSWRDITIANSSLTVTFGNLLPITRNLTLIADNAAVTLGQVSVGGDLQLRASGSIIESGAWQVAGNTLLETDGINANIDVSDNSGSFAGTLSVRRLGSGSLANVNLVNQSLTGTVGVIDAVQGDLLINFAGGVMLPALDVGGQLLVMSGGAVLQSGVLHVGGDTIVYLQNGPSDVLLNNPANFMHELQIVASGPTAGAIEFRSLAADARVSTLPSVVSSLLLDFAQAAIDLPSIAVSNQVSLTAHGDILQHGAWLIGGDLQLTTTLPGSDVVVNHIGNAIHGAISVNSPAGMIARIDLRSNDAAATLGILPSQIGLLTVNFQGDVELPTVHVFDDLTINAGGTLSADLGAMVRVDGLTQWTANEIRMGTAGQLIILNRIQLQATQDAELVAASDIRLSGINSANNMTLVSGGGIFEQAGTQVHVADHAAFTANQLTLGYATGGLTAGTLQFNVNQRADVLVDGDAVFRGDSRGDQLWVNATGDVRDLGDAYVEVTGLVRLVAQGSITLADTGAATWLVTGETWLETTHGNVFVGVDPNSALAVGLANTVVRLRDLLVDGNLVRIAEDDEINLNYLNADETQLISSMGIRDATTASIAVLGDARLVAPTVVLGDEAASVNFGRVAFDVSGEVNIKEQSAARIFGPSSAGSLRYFADGAIESLTGDGGLIVLDEAIFETTGGPSAVIRIDNSAASLGRVAATMWNPSQTTLGTGSIRLAVNSTLNLDVLQTLGQIDVFTASSVTAHTSVDPNLRGDRVSVQAGTGIGVANAVRVSANELTAVSSQGDVNVQTENSPSLRLVVPLIATGNGNLSLRNITGDAVEVNTATTSQGGIVLVNNLGDLVVNHARAATVFGGDGDVWLETVAQGNITVGTVLAAGDLITVRAAERVFDMLPSVLPDWGLLGNRVVVQAGTGVGSVADALEITAGHATVQSAQGDLVLLLDSTPLASGIVLDDVRTGQGAILVTQQGAHDLVVTNLRNSAGSVQVTNPSGGIELVAADLGTTDPAEGSLTVNASGNILVGRVAAAGDQIRLQTSGSVREMGTDAAVDLRADGLAVIAPLGFGTSVNPIETDVRRVEVMGGSGGIHQVNTGSLTVGGVDGAINGITATSDRIIVTSGSLNIVEPIRHVGGQDVRLRALAGGIQVAAPVQIVNGMGVLQLQSADPVTMTGGGELRTPTGRVGALPLNVSVNPISTFGSTVDSNGFTRVLVTINDPLGLNYGLSIDWGDGIDRFPASNSPGSGLTGSTTLEFTHTYIANPNSNDRAARIPITVRVQPDFRGPASSGIEILGGTGQRLDFATVVDLIPPGQGIVPAITFITVEEITRFEAPAVRTSQPDFQITLVNTAQIVEQPPSSSSAVTDPQKRVLLRVVSPSGEEGEEVELEAGDLTRIPDLLSRLPDNRYRVYLMMEDGTMRLVRDVTVQKGVPTALAAADELPERLVTKMVSGTEAGQRSLAGEWGWELSQPAPKGAGTPGEPSTMNGEAGPLDAAAGSWGAGLTPDNGRTSLNRAGTPTSDHQHATGSAANGAESSEDSAAATPLERLQAYGWPAAVGATGAAAYWQLQRRLRKAQRVAERGGSRGRDRDQVSPWSRAARLARQVARLRNRGA